METQAPICFALDGRQVFLLRAAPKPDLPLPLVLLPTDGAGAAQGREIAAMLQSAEAPFALAGFDAGDWNAALTPWPAPGLSKKAGNFAGRGPETLDWLTQSLLPHLRGRTPLLEGAQNTCLLGYSLAGLFSLWAFLESGLFGGCACCSGSLWYDGWGQYLDTAAPPAGGRVYLSLGSAEEKARNPRMAAVGDATRHTFEALEQSPAIADAVLEWNEGGHFNDPAGRLARGLRFLVAP